MVYRWEKEKQRGELEMRNSGGQKKSVNSLKIKIAVAMALAALVLTFTMAIISLKLYESNSRSEHIRMANGAVELAAGSIDVDMVGEYIKNGKSTEGYAQSHKRLCEIRENIPDIKYLYVYQILEDGCHTISDTDVEGQDFAVGELIEFDETFLPLVPDLLAGKEIEPLESNDRYGWLLTVYRPTFGSDGKTCVYVGADISMDKLKEYERQFIGKIALYFVGIFVVILTIGLWLSNRYLSKPINRIAYYAGDFMSSNGNLAEMNACVERIKELGIHTGDEVENLYHSFSQMTEDMVSHIKNIREQASTINRMQNERIQIMERYQSDLENKVVERTHELRQEKEKSERLLLNILPAPIAKELSEKPGQIIAKKYPNVTVLFTDIVGFTKLSDRMSAEQVVTMLNKLVSRFDIRAQESGIEKIKTIGDAYMAAVGLMEDAGNGGAERMVRFAQGLIEDVRSFNERYKSNLKIRLGINTGNLVAGVIGKTKFIYDIWGDTVNVASRMESTGEPMKIHVSESSYEQTKDVFSYGESVEVEVKGKGKMRTYFL